MFKSKIIISIVCLFTYFLPASSQTNNTMPGELKVGAAKISITPAESMIPESYSGIHDSLFIRTIVIDNGIQRAALISIDLISVPGESELKEAISQELKISPEYVYISAIHSHNSPYVLSPQKMKALQAKFGSKGNSFFSTSPGYYNIIKEASILSAKEALSQLQPARMGFAEGKAYVNVNRDQKIGEGYHMGYNPDGPSDKTVAVITFTNLEGDPIAVYANYPVHAVVMFRAKTKDGKPEISADIAGATASYVEQHFNKAIVLWTSGAAGDQNPLFMANYNQDAPDVYDEGVAGYAILDVLARRLGEEIVHLTKSTINTTKDVTIWAKETSVTCPGQKREALPEDGAPMQGYLAPAKIKMIDGDPVKIPLHLLMINEIALTGVSGEVFTEIGIRLKKQSPFDHTIMVTNLPNGIGYIPTDEAYLMPSEKAITNNLKPGFAEPKIIQAFMDMMNSYVKENR